MTSALMLIPEAPGALALAPIEAEASAWLATEDDLAVLREARRRLRTWREYYDRSTEEGLAAARLTLDAERRIGSLPEVAPKPQGGTLPRVTAGYTTPDAERMALSRARSLAAVPEPVYQQVRNGPSPSRAAVLAAVQPLHIIDGDEPDDPEGEARAAASRALFPELVKALTTIKAMCKEDRYRRVMFDITPEQHERLRTLARTTAKAVSAYDADVLA